MRLLKAVDDPSGRRLYYDRSALYAGGDTVDEAQAAFSARLAELDEDDIEIASAEGEPEAWQSHGRQWYGYRRPVTLRARPRAGR